MTEEELISGLDELFGEGYSEEFRHRTKELFAKAVVAYTAELQEQIETMDEICEQLAETCLAHEEMACFNHVAEGLPATSKSRFRTLTEGIIFDDDPETYMNKLRQARQMHFPMNPTPSKLDYDLPLDEPKKSKAVDPLIEASVKHLKDYRS